MIREKVGNPVNLMPGDELTVTVDRPMCVSIVNEIDDSIALVENWREWGDLKSLQAEVQKLRSQVKHLNWRLDNEVWQYEEAGL